MIKDTKINTFREQNIHSVIEQLACKSNIQLAALLDIMITCTYIDTNVTALQDFDSC